MYIFIFVEDGQCASGTTVLLQPHVVCSLKEHIKFEYYEYYTMIFGCNVGVPRPLAQLHI